MHISANNTFLDRVKLVYVASWKNVITKITMVQILSLRKGIGLSPKEGSRSK